MNNFKPTTSESEAQAWWEEISGKPYVPHLWGDNFSFREARRGRNEKYQYDWVLMNFREANGRIRVVLARNPPLKEAE